jgi:hypothetical protein
VTIREDLHAIISRDASNIRPAVVCHLQDERVQSLMPQQATLKIIVLSGCEGVANLVQVRTDDGFEIPNEPRLRPTWLPPGYHNEVPCSWLVPSVLVTPLASTRLLDRCPTSQWNRLSCPMDAAVYFAPGGLLSYIPCIDRGVMVDARHALLSGGRGVH